MKITPQTPEQMRAALLGVQLATKDALVALIKLQANIAAVADQMWTEREETLALLLNKGVPDTTIEVYRDTIDSIRPHRSCEDMNPS